MNQCLIQREVLYRRHDPINKMGPGSIGIYTCTDYHCQGIFKGLSLSFVYRKEHRSHQHQILSTILAHRILRKPYVNQQSALHGVQAAKLTHANHPLAMQFGPGPTSICQLFQPMRLIGSSRTTGPVLSSCDKSAAVQWWWGLGRYR